MSINFELLYFCVLFHFVIEAFFKCAHFIENPISCFSDGNERTGQVFDETVHRPTFYHSPAEVYV